MPQIKLMTLTDYPKCLLCIRTNESMLVCNIRTYVYLHIVHTYYMYVHYVHVHTYVHSMLLEICPKHVSCLRSTSPPM